MSNTTDHDKHSKKKTDICRSYSCSQLESYWNWPGAIPNCPGKNCDFSGSGGGSGGGGGSGDDDSSGGGGGGGGGSGDDDSSGGSGGGDGDDDGSGGEETMALITRKKIHTMTQLTTIMMTIQTLISKIARHTLNIGYGILLLLATKTLQIRQTVNVHPQQSFYKMEIYSALMELMLLHTVPMSAIFVTHV